MPAFLSKRMQAFFCLLSAHLNKQEDLFIIQPGDQLRPGRLVEFSENQDRTLVTQVLDVNESLKGKTIAVLALPVVFAPGISRRVKVVRSQGVDEIWYLGVLDPALMACWSREPKSAAGVRLLTDGSGICSQALGLSAEYAVARSSLLVEDGILAQVNIDAADRTAASSDEGLVAAAA